MRNQALSVEDDSRLWEEAAEKARREFEELRAPYERAEREKARLKADQEVVEAKRQVELFVAKSTLPYSEPLAIEIAERVSSGELLINICADEHTPTMRRVTEWLKESDEFSALHKESMNDRLNIFQEEVIKIADDASRDFKEVTRGNRMVRVVDGEAIARAKLRVEVRFRDLKAFRPAVWGDQSTLNVKNQDTSEIDNMSLDELGKRIADLEIKDRPSKAA